MTDLLVTKVNENLRPLSYPEQKSGIDKILPCMKIDDYLFDPCGYSMNGILKNESVDYGLVNMALIFTCQML